MMSVKRTTFFKWLALVLLSGLMISQSVSAATLYLVRHAEKELGDNPALTEQGKQRAERIAQILKYADVKAIYSTDYLRTNETAQPTAAIHGLMVRTYDPDKLATFAELILENNESAVIVGHSNTTPELTALLSKVKVESMSEEQFGLIYQVILPGIKTEGNDIEGNSILLVLSSDAE